MDILILVHFSFALLCRLGIEDNTVHKNSGTHPVPCLSSFVGAQLISSSFILAQSCFEARAHVHEARRATNVEAGDATHTVKKSSLRAILHAQMGPFLAPGLLAAND